MLQHYTNSIKAALMMEVRTVESLNRWPGAHWSVAGQEARSVAAGQCVHSHSRHCRMSGLWFSASTSTLLCS